MAIQIERSHALGRDEAIRRVDRIRSNVQAKYGLNSDWDADCLNFTGTGVNGHIKVSEDKIRVDVRLGFSMMMLEGVIKSQLSDEIDQNLA